MSTHMSHDATAKRSRCRRIFTLPPLVASSPRLASPLTSSLLTSSLPRFLPWRAPKPARGNHAPACDLISRGFRSCFGHRFAHIRFSVFLVFFSVFFFVLKKTGVHVHLHTAPSTTLCFFFRGAFFVPDHLTCSILPRAFERRQYHRKRSSHVEL